jgi:hypothetical protein
MLLCNREREGQFEFGALALSPSIKHNIIQMSAVDVIQKLMLTWRQFTLQHIHGHDVDDENPDGALQYIALRLYER